MGGLEYLPAAAVECCVGYQQAIYPEFSAHAMGFQPEVGLQEEEYERPVLMVAGKRRSDAKRDRRVTPSQGEVDQRQSVGDRGLEEST